MRFLTETVFRVSLRYEISQDGCANNRRSAKIAGTSAAKLSGAVSLTSAKFHFEIGGEKRISRHLTQGHDSGSTHMLGRYYGQFDSTVQKRPVLASRCVGARG
jgi:hypothetical protein